MRKEHKPVPQRRDKAGSFTLPKPCTWRDVYTSRWFLPILCTLGLAIILNLRLIADIDIGFHLRGGQWMLENMSFHQKDVFTYTVKGNEYLAMYWLFQIMVYLFFKLSSYAGLIILKTSIIVIVFFLIFLRMKRAGAPLWISVPALLLLTFIMKLRFELRPELFTWIFMVAMLLVLDSYLHYKKKNLFWLVIIQLVWANCHGLFILGWIISGAYFISLLIHERRFDKVFAGWFLLQILVPLLNPYFLKGVGFPFYLFTRLQGSSIFKTTIGELRSPWVMPAHANTPVLPDALPLYMYYALTFVCLTLVITTYKKRKIHEYLLLIAFFYLSFTAIRNIALFVIIAIQILVLSLNDFHAMLKTRVINLRGLKYLSVWTPIAYTIFVLHLYPRIISNAFYVAERHAYNFGLGLDPLFQPVQASSFIVNNHLDGRIINDINSGSWLIWSVPQPVFIDGRLEVIKESFYKEYLQSFAPGGLARLIQKYNPKIIFFDYLVGLSWNDQLRAMNDWRLIYWDQTSAIYVHDNDGQQLPDIKFTKEIYEMGIDTLLADQKVWDILRTPKKSNVMRWLDGFIHKQPYPFGLLKMGIFAFQNNELRAGELLHLEFIKRTRGNIFEAYFNLGSLYYAIGDYPKSLYCYERVLSEQPGNEKANERVSEMKHLLQIP